MIDLGQTNRRAFLFCMSSTAAAAATLTDVLCAQAPPHHSPHSLLPVSRFPSPTLSTPPTSLLRTCQVKIVSILRTPSYFSVFLTKIWNRRDTQTAAPGSVHESPTACESTGRNVSRATPRTDCGGKTRKREQESKKEIPLRA